MSETYAGSTMEASLTLPAANDLASFGAVPWEGGECSMQQFPAISRSFDAVTEPLVCRLTNRNKKGASNWNDMVIPLSRLPGDAMQTILRTLEGSFAIGSFKFTINNSGIVYVQAQVATMPIADGGGQNTIHTSTLTLFIQEEPVLDGA